MFMGQNCRSLEKRMKKQALPSVLGTLSPDVFMRTYWQKKPLLIRQAVSQGLPLLSRQALFALAGQEGVESRLITGDIRRNQWTFAHGPFKPRDLPALKTPDWTLLVQGVDLHHDALAHLRDRFRFVPDARLDDLMISYASDGGGVGPHFDSYDVFLLQTHGQRRWRISPQTDLRLRADVPLKILKAFKPTETFVLDPGDMLYLPPHYAHEGVAIGECMTCSIGFKAESPQSLVGELLPRLADMGPEQHAALYQDPGQQAAQHPAQIPPALQRFARRSLEEAVKRATDLHCALGEFLTEPKSQVWFEAQAEAKALKGVQLDRKSKMLYDEEYVYMNGESWRCAGADATCLRQLADQRGLEAAQTAKASKAVKALLKDWMASGWIHPQ
jgi:50S ribosomal protein L16 3-hydroxylase